MTEEELDGAGWEPQQFHSRIWGKPIGRASARVDPNDSSSRGWAFCYLDKRTHVQARAQEVTGTLAFCARYAEEQARAIDAWLAGDETAAIEHARSAVGEATTDAEK